MKEGFQHKNKKPPNRTIINNTTTNRTNLIQNKGKISLRQVASVKKNFLFSSQLRGEVVERLSLVNGATVVPNEKVCFDFNQIVCHVCVFCFWGCCELATNQHVANKKRKKKKKKKKKKSVFGIRTYSILKKKKKKLFVIFVYYFSFCFTFFTFLFQLLLFVFEVDDNVFICQIQVRNEASKKKKKKKKNQARKNPGRSWL